VPVTEFGCAGASGAGIPSRGDSGHDAQHYAMLRRNLPYTGVTRGKRLVVLVGQKKADLQARVVAPMLTGWAQL
jgi:hypothetical protein